MPARALDWIRNRSAVFWLTLVAAFFAVAQVALIPLDMYLSWDEAIYASQYSDSVNQMGMSAHRSPGVPLLLAPVTLFTASTTVIRGYLTVLSTVALFFAYRSWVVVDARVAPLGALLFATSSVALVNAHQALPNVLTALATVAALGCFVAAGQHPGRRWGALAGVAGAFAVASLMRPTDAVFVAAPLLAATVLVRRWRRLPLAASVVAGLGVGGIAWLVEAWARFGGPFDRLSAMRDTTQAGSDPVALQGLAIATDYAADHPVVAVLIVVGCVAVVAGVVLAVRHVCAGWPAPAWVLTVATASVIGLPYYLLLSYTSDRYLLPAQGLLALAAGAAVCRLVTSWAGATRVAVSVVSAAAVVMYAGSQLTAAADEAHGLRLVRDARQGYAEQLGGLGMHPPCVISGVQAPAFAYTLGCTAEDIISPVPNWEARKQALIRDRATARRQGAKLVVVLYGEDRPGRVEGWRRVPLDEDGPIYAYFPPGQP